MEKCGVQAEKSCASLYVWESSEVLSLMCVTAVHYESLRRVREVMPLGRIAFTLVESACTV
jgi:hypothetical protein